MPPNLLIKPVAQTAPAKPKLPNLNPGVGPQNVGLPGYRPGDVGNPNGQLAPGLSAPAPLQAAPAAAAPAAAAPPVDYWNAAKLDPQYMTGLADLIAQNNSLVGDPNVKGDIGTLGRGWQTQSQGYQDNANAHGALFSGAAVHAQNYAGQQYADQQAAQARNLLSGEHTLQSNVFNRMLSQLAGTSTVPTLGVTP